MTDEQVNKAWAVLGDIVLGEPVHGEVLSRELRVAIQKSICEAVEMRPYGAQFVNGCMYAISMLTAMAKRTERIATDHDEAIVRHAQHARWRNLYRLAKRTARHGDPKRDVPTDSAGYSNV